MQINDSGIPPVIPPGPGSALHATPTEDWQRSQYPADAWRNNGAKLPSTGVPDADRLQVELVETTTQLYRTEDAGKGLFESLPYMAQVHTYQIDGRQLEVVLPLSPDKGTYLPSADEVAKAVASLPEEARADTVRIEFSPSPDGVAYVNNENGPGTVFVAAYEHPVTQRDLDTVLLHETAHIIDQPDADQWRQAVESDGVFPTSYAESKYGESGKPITEDFAESYQIYQLVQGTPDEAAMRAIYPERFALLDRMQASQAPTPLPPSPWHPFLGDPSISVQPQGFNPGSDAGIGVDLGPGDDPGIYVVPPSEDAAAAGVVEA